VWKKFAWKKGPIPSDGCSSRPLELICSTLVFGASGLVLLDTANNLERAESGGESRALLEF
jgi:hypothetical protein